MSSSPQRHDFVGAALCGRPVFSGLLILALFSALGCGKQGPPLPPLRAVPAPVKDLTVVQQGPRLLLSFTYPTVTPAGTALAGISAVEIWSVSRVAPGGKPATIDAREFGNVAKPVQKVEGADLTSATSGSRIDIALTLPPTLLSPAPAIPAAAAPPAVTPPAATAIPAPAGPQPQAGYFAVRTLGKNGDRSELSNIVSLVPTAPPASPSRVTVTARGDGVLVEWTPVEGTVAGYNVYRRGAQERANAKPVHTAGAQEKSWLDSTARFGQSYIYGVTALSQTQPPIESAIASEHEVRYVDRFAPPPPTELVALAETGRVRLVWRPSEAEDVAGYIVYRRAGDGGKFERVTPKPVEAAEYVDTAVAGGRTYTYRVTAVDQAGNESGPGNEVRAAAP
jgi:fibronectin type 3 domain-containing protein/predicted small lipoprotein YifL